MVATVARFIHFFTSHGHHRRVSNIRISTEIDASIIHRTLDLLDLDKNCTFQKENP